MNQQKNIIRKKFINIRNNISITRRAVAEKKALNIAKLNFSAILSFANKPKEINLWPLNKKLAKEKRLFLPKITNNTLEIFKVTDLENQLIKGKFNLLEPDPKTCQKTDIKNISCILVPGLAFDKHNNRIGYGKGFYDRLLKMAQCPFLGVGFIEQESIELLPFESHDIKLNHLLLF